MVCLFYYGSCCGNHELGIIKCAAVVPQTNTFCSKAHTNSEKQKRQTCQTTPRSDENTQKIKQKRIQKERNVSSTIVFLKYLSFCIPSFYLHIIQCAASKRCGFELGCGFTLVASSASIPMRTLVDFRLRAWDVYF